MTSISPQLPSCSPAPVPTGAKRHLKLTQLLLIFTVWLWDKGDFEWDWTETHTGKLSGTKGRSWGEGHFSKCSQNHQKQVLCWFPAWTSPIHFNACLLLDYLDLWSFTEVFCRRECVIAQLHWLGPEPGAVFGSIRVSHCVETSSSMDISVQCPVPVTAGFASQAP